MPKQEQLEKMPAKELHVFFVLDTSGSMSGAPIAALNDAMRATLDELKQVDAASNDADIRVGVMQFSTGAEWVTVNQNGEPIVSFLNDYDWYDLKAGGMTHLGAALTELKKQLSRNSLQKAKTGNWAPVVIFMSDGEPNDEWMEPLRELKTNKWYQQAIKIGFALGEDADSQVLSEIVGASEAVIETNDLETFKKMITLTAVTASLAGSRSVVQDTSVTGTEVVHAATGGLCGNGPNGTTQVPSPGTIPDPYIDIYGAGPDTYPTGTFGKSDDYD